MDKRFSLIFLAVSAAFFVFIVGFTGYRTEDARRRNATQARERASALAAKAASLVEAAGGYDAPEFAKGMRTAFDGESRLLLLCIRAETGGIEYFVARHRSYLKVPASITAEWRGAPAYRIARGYEVLVNRPLGEGPSQGSLDTLFITMGREDLYTILRDDLYLFLAFLLVSGVYILIVMSIPQESPRRATPPGPSAKTAGPVGTELAAVPPTPARTLASPHSGLVWAEYLAPRLRAELERASAADQDIALARVRIDDPPADSRLRIIYGGIAKMLKETFPLHDLIFETGVDSFALLLPDADIDSAVKSLESFRKKVAATPIDGKSITISIGASSRGGRLVDEKTLLEEGDVSVAKAYREGGNCVIGFRADPSKFRAALSGQRL